MAETLRNYKYSISLRAFPGSLGPRKGVLFSGFVVCTGLSGNSWFVMKWLIHLEFKDNISHMFPQLCSKSNITVFVKTCVPTLPASCNKWWSEFERSLFASFSFTRTMTQLLEITLLIFLDICLVIPFLPQWILRIQKGNHSMVRETKTENDFP